MNFDQKEMHPHEAGHADGFHRIPYNNEFEEGSQEHQQYHDGYQQGAQYF